MLMRGEGTREKKHPTVTSTAPARHVMHGAGEHLPAASLLFATISKGTAQL
jgi:hypothetical protein